jgi:predicted transposase YbfD/YdcC
MLDTPKKTVQQIIAAGSDYLIAVKANQPTLLRQLQHQFQMSMPLSIASEIERTRNRCTQRPVRVLEPSSEIDPAWVGLRRVIQVERTGTRAGKPVAETVFYISSCTKDATEFAQQIRQHWHIENRLHWVKDVVFQEDKTPLCTGHALVNVAILRTMVINLFRQRGFSSMTQAIRSVAHDVCCLFSFFQ